MVRCNPALTFQHPYPPTKVAFIPDKGLVPPLGLSNYGPQQLAKIGCSCRKRTYRWLWYKCNIFSSVVAQRGVCHSCM